MGLYRLLAGCSAGWRAGWVTELLGLRGLLECVLGFLVLLEGGLNHVVCHGFLRAEFGYREDTDPRILNSTDCKGQVTNPFKNYVGTFSYESGFQTRLNPFQNFSF